MDLAVCGLPISRSARSIGSPEAADDAGIAGHLDAGADLVFHLHLVPPCQDDNAGVLLVFVGNHQLGQDGEDLEDQPG